MEELLKKLLAADILTEDTKAELETAFNQQLKEAVDAAEAETRATVQATLAEQWITERDALIDAVDTKVSDFLSKELEELKEDVERFRDLEAEHAQKLVEAKELMAKEVEADMTTLVEKMNAFLEIRLSKEFEELKEDIEEAKKLQFGKTIFESFAAEFSQRFTAEEGSVEAELVDVKKQLEEALLQISETKKLAESEQRKTKMSELLAPLSGKQREIMETILRNIPTAQLDDGYNTFIGRVISENTQESTNEKEDKVLAESDSEETKPEPIEGKVVTGNTEEVLKESADTDHVVVSNEHLEHLRRLAGIKQ